MLQEEQIIVLVCLIISIVVGNVVVLFAIGLSKRGKRSRMNFFIMQLAIAGKVAAEMTIYACYVEASTVFYVYDKAREALHS